MEGQTAITINPQDLIMIIGQQTIQIRVLEQQLEQMKQLIKDKSDGVSDTIKES